MIKLLLLSCIFALPIPEYMKDAVITVKTKDGQEYTFKGDKYKVVNRQSPVKTMNSFNYSPKRSNSVKQHRHILSLDMVSSFSGKLNLNKTNTYVEVESERELGLGLQYQYLFLDSIYLNGRIDTNGGVGLGIGTGFE